MVALPPLPGARLTLFAAAEEALEKARDTAGRSPGCGTRHVLGSAQPVHGECPVGVYRDRDEAGGEDRPDVLALGLGLGALDPVEGLVAHELHVPAVRIGDRL